MNIHPQTVHFPIALLITAGGIYIYGFIKSDHPKIHMGSLIHTLGLLGMIAAIISGKITQGSIQQNDQIAAILRQHEIMAYGTIWVFSVLWVWQFVRKKYLVQDYFNWEKLIFAVIFIISLCFMGYSAHLGGKMVYEHGTGVIPMEKMLKDQ